MTSKIKVDNINKVSDDSNIINKCGTNITMGANGDTVIIPNGVTEQVQSGGEIQVQSGGQITIASGATITNNGTQVGFGREGTVNWDTTPKTTTFTAVNGTGYFLNSGSSITVNLPAGSAGAIVSVADYARNFNTYPCAVSPNGSEKIGGVAEDATLGVDGQAATFVYVDSTKGWVNVQNAEDTTTGVAPWIVASVSGACNTLATCGDYKIATFKGPGTFCVSGAGNPSGSTQVDYMIVAGGAGGAGKNNGGGVGGGGAGGIRIGTVTQPSPLSPSPLVGPGFTVSKQAYPIVIGGGGACSTNVPDGTAGYSGDASSAFCLTAAGGGGGNDAADDGASGGSGGGGGEAGGTGGAGNTPPTPIAQGNPGGTGNSPSVGAGGGGFTAAGCNSTPAPSSPTGNGGNGIDAGPIFGTGSGSPGGNFGGGGGASVGDPSAGPFSGGSGGGGQGNAHDQASASGATNTGGGGGAHGSTGAPQGGTNGGGSGIVMIRYKFQ